VSYFTLARNNAVLCTRTQAEFVGRFAVPATVRAAVTLNKSKSKS
jgi:hypothetical protein